jgi:predicted acyl esterase
VPGELDTGTLEPGSADLRDTYQGRIVSDWMAHWLKDAKTDLGPGVRYFRDWAYTPPADPSDRAAALAAVQQAYATSGNHPGGFTTSLSLSGGRDLLPAGTAVQDGDASFVSTGATPATSTGEVVVDDATTPSLDAPGTFAAWTGVPLAAPLDVAGIPELQVRFNARLLAATQTSSPLGKLMLFAKLYDVAPDGSRTLVKDLVAAARIPDVTKPARIALPGVVHRFAPGHRVQLVLAASDATYKGTGLPGTVTVVDSPPAPNVLSLPVVR